jgi:nucleotide-binding universal stress UspA family protein
MSASPNIPLINTDGRVVAAIDISAYAGSVAAHAGWAAARLAAPLELLHTLDRSVTPVAGDLSGNLSVDNREALLEELASLDERRARLAQEHGRSLLEEARDRVSQEHGVRADILQRHGGLVETLLDREADVRLFVIGKRGEHADFSKGHLGSNLERVLRSVHRPALVASRAFKPIERFMIAFDGSATTRKCVEMVCISPLFKGLCCDLLTVGEPGAGHDASLAWAEEKLRGAGFEPRVRRVAGSPDAVIAQEVAEHGVDLLVMGAYGHSKIRNLIVGSTTTQVLRSCLIPVLLLR